MNKVQAETKRVNFHIPAELHTAIKVKAAQNGNTFTQEMIKASKDSLKEPLGGLSPHSIDMIRRYAEMNDVEINEYVRRLLLNADSY